MPRRRKYPKYVRIKIPFETLEVWEQDFFNILFEEKEAETARKIIFWLQNHDRIWSDEYKQIVGTNDAEVKRYNRVMAKMITLGLIDRGKDGRIF